MSAPPHDRPASRKRKWWSDVDFTEAGALCSGRQEYDTSRMPLFGSCYDREISVTKQYEVRSAVSLDKRRATSIIFIISALIQLAGAQLLCPNSLTEMCNSCPRTCQTSCSTRTHNVKCPGASWGNTNLTNMNVTCSVPAGMDKESYPVIPQQWATMSAPLLCSGIVLKGLWPFDADHMTFPVESMFRDPLNPLQRINAKFLNCLTVGLRVTSVSAVDDPYYPNSAEKGSCLLTRAEVESAAYDGLSLYTCTGSNVLDDPLCRNGEWIEIVHGTCVGERVFGNFELTELGSRALLRVGGPSKLTGSCPAVLMEIPQVCLGEMS
jgi:hypothetical protein